MDSAFWLFAFAIWLGLIVAAYVWVLRWLWTTSPFTTGARVAWTVAVFFPLAPLVGLLALVAVRVTYLVRDRGRTADVALAGVVDVRA